VKRNPGRIKNVTEWKIVFGRQTRYAARNRGRFSCHAAYRRAGYPSREFSAGPTTAFRVNAEVSVENPSSVSTPIARNNRTGPTPLSAASVWYTTRVNVHILGRNQIGRTNRTTVRIFTVVVRTKWRVLGQHNRPGGRQTNSTRGARRKSTDG